MGKIHFDLGFFLYIEVGCLGIGYFITRYLFSEKNGSILSKEMDAKLRGASIE